MREVITLVARVLLFLVVCLWIIQLIYCTAAYFRGGPEAVIGWLFHVANTSANIHAPTSWKDVVIPEAVLVGITVALIFLSRSAQKNVAA
jgi:hypothetical protein